MPQTHTPRIDHLWGAELAVGWMVKGRWGGGRGEIVAMVMRRKVMR